MDRFELLLANAAHLKAVPGRKTDARDAEWIAELLRHGLLRASFIPPRPERELMLWDEPHPRARLRDQPPAKGAGGRHHHSRLGEHQPGAVRSSVR